MNHLIATSRRVLTSAVVTEALADINARRFNGFWHIVRTGTHWCVEHPGPLELWNYRFACWLETKRTMEFRPSVGQFSWWLVTVFQDELAVRFRGRCGAPSGARWAPDVGLYPSYRAFWEGTLRDGLEDDKMEFLTTLFDREVASMPPDVQAFV